MQLLAVILLSSLMGQISWATKTPIPQALAGSGCAIINDTVYVIGGRDSAGNRYTTNYIYDPANDTWSAKSNMQIARAHLCCAAVNGKFYAIGGWVGGSAGSTGAVEEYDPATGTWTTKTSMPTPRYTICSAVVQNKVYVIGGMSISGVIFATVEEYSPSADTAGGNPWQTKTSMPTARMGPGCAVIKDTIYVFGGSTSIGTGVTGVNQCYDPISDTWSTKTNMPTPRYALGGFSYSDKAYAVGGYNYYNYFSTVEVYDPFYNSWSSESSMQFPRQSVATALFGNKVYVIGGWNNGALNYTEEGSFPVSIAEDDQIQGTENLKLSVSPNPFTSKAEIRYKIPEIGKIENRNFPISLCICDISGRVVRNFPISNFKFPVSEVSWDGRDANGNKLPGGTYLVKISSKELNKTSKLVLVR